MIPESELRRLYIDEQRSTCAIALMFNTTGATVCNWLCNYRIPRRGRSEAATLSNAARGANMRRHEARLRQMWPEPGVTIADIAEALGTARPTVRKWASRLGLGPKPCLRMKEPRRGSVTLPRVPAGVDGGAVSVPPFRPARLITFLPESPRLEMEFRRSVAAARMERRWS